MSGKFEIKATSDGRFHFVLKAANGAVVLSSQMYAAKASAKEGVESVKNNATHDERYTRETSSKGEPYFSLVAANHQVVGTSQMYASASSRDEGIASVKANAPKAEVVDLTA